VPEAGARLTAAIMARRRRGNVTLPDFLVAGVPKAGTPGRPARGRPRTAAARNRDAAGDRGPALAIFPACTLVSYATLREHVTDH
jgi:hypothetical protein